MRKVKLLEHREFVTPAKGDRRRRPFADAVHSKDRSLGKAGRKECRRRMALVMFAEKEFFVPGKLFGEFPQFIAQQLLLEQFFAQP